MCPSACRAGGPPATLLLHQHTKLILEHGTQHKPVVLCARVKGDRQGRESILSAQLAQHTSAFLLRKSVWKRGWTLAYNDDTYLREFAQIQFTRATQTARPSELAPCARSYLHLVPPRARSYIVSYLHKFRNAVFVHQPRVAPAARWLELQVKAPPSGAPHRHRLQLAPGTLQRQCPRGQEAGGLTVLALGSDED